MTAVIRKELTKFRDEYQTPRKTQILSEAVQEFQQKAEEETDVVFVMDRFGYAKTISTETLEKNREAVENDYRYHVLCRNTGKICLFTNIGNLYTVRTADLPAGKLRDKGRPIDNVCDFDESKESIVFITSQSSLNLFRILFVTKEAMVKLVSGGEFDVTRRKIAATNLAEGDELVYAAAVTGQNAVVLWTKNGYFLKFGVDEIAEQKKNARGVHGMKLTQQDTVEGALLLDPSGDHVLHWHEKDIDLDRLRLAGRGGRGTKH